MPCRLMAAQQQGKEANRRTDTGRERESKGRYA
jgi:hypothetical protein